MEIQGEIVYMELEDGFWGIKTSEQNYFPINMHEQLKTAGTKVVCSIIVMDDLMTIQNWGLPCKISAFTTLGS